jgi:flavin-dependent dehydrogenase
MTDLIVVGAGPAGIVAATVAARAGARVRLLDRARFPRDKLCGDTVNPGALALLGRLKMAGQLEQGGLRVDGMMVTGDDGVTVEARYPEGLCGRAMVRRDLDWSLLQEAIAAGVEFEPLTSVRRALPGARPQTTVGGVVIDAGGSERTLRSSVVIAADGRHSTLTFGLGLARHPERPRRWAVGAYFENVAGLSSLGEMHIRQGRYIGVAPVPGGLANVCLVKPWAPPAGEFRDPEALLRRELARDPRLADRFAGARLAGPPVVLGPLAVDVSSRRIDGLILAGDAAGFIDPMTGDGMRFAVRGGELAAQAALDALQHGWSRVHTRLDRQRRHEFAGKWRFNRTLRSLVALPVAVRVGGAVASLAPVALRAVVRHAGDCELAGLGA